MLWFDIRHSIRSLSRLPGFTLICMITLALGIGATTSIFSALYRIVLNPMPFDGGDRLVYVWVQDSASGMAMSPPLSYLDAWRGRLRSFDGVESYTPGEYTLLEGTEPELIKGAAISSGLPAMLGVNTIAGRTFSDDEMRRNAADVVVLSEGIAKRRFGGARDAIGKLVQTSDGKRHEVIGVLPSSFAAFESFQGEGQMWFPLRPDTASQLRDVNVIGKLKEGVTAETANAELGVVAAGVKLDASATMPGKWSPKVMTPQDFLDSTTQRGLPILLAAVACVLLIGCANIAGLLLVRLNSRRRELGIRAAVGARRATIIRLLMVEAMLIAVGGGVIGIFVATWITNGIRAFRPEGLNSLDAIRTDGVSLAFAACVSLITALVFGVAPVITTLRRDLTGGLISSAGTNTRVTSSNRARMLMVGGQIALSLLLLIASLLLVRSVRELQNKDLGFEPENVLTFGVYLKDGTPEATSKAFFDALIPKLRTLPGARAVSISTGVPSKGGIMQAEVSVPGRELTDAERPPFLGFTGVSPEYDDVIGLRLREGRFITAADKDDQIVINESWANKLWPNASALGHQIKLGPTADPRTIVGVVADVATMGARATADRPHLYSAYSYSFPRASISIKTDGRDPASLAPAVRTALRNADPTLVARDVASLSDLMAGTIALDRFYMLLLSSFAGLALLLSVIGLYGVISNTVAQRTREIGVRMALGATPGDLQSMVFRQALTIVGAGLIAGGVAAYFLTKYLESELHGVSAKDPVSFLTAGALLTVGALIATYVPARRALRVDPLQALRAE